MAGLTSTLRNVFNYASLPVYMANEGLQKLNGMGVHVYRHIPEGTFVRNYASDLAGAAALAWIIDANLKHNTPSWMPLERHIRAASTEISIAASAALLTVWQMTMRTQMDMGNMKCFAAALACYYLLNKRKPEPAAPSQTPQ